MTEMVRSKFKISVDELENRMEKQKLFHDEPIKKAVTLLDLALERVLARLGVNVELGDIPTQQVALGIVIAEETRVEMAGLQGYFIYVTRRGDLIPYAWIGAARLDREGRCWVNIHYFQDEQLEEMGGVKIL